MFKREGKGESCAALCRSARLVRVREEGGRVGRREARGEGMEKESAGGKGRGGGRRRWAEKGGENGKEEGEGEKIKMREGGE